MKESQNSDKCSNCGKCLPDNHRGPCPSCGKIGKTITGTVSDGVNLSDTLKLTSIKEYYEKNRLALVFVILVTIISPFLGFFIIGP